MSRAFALAAARPVTPRIRIRASVACCCVTSEIVGEGWHERAGEAHAEPIAVRGAGDRARGATAYVTLEPCNHHGRTPPCIDGLMEAGVRRVVLRHWRSQSAGVGGGAKRLRRSRRGSGIGSARDGSRSTESRLSEAHAHRHAVRAGQAGRQSRWAHGAGLWREPLDHLEEARAGRAVLSCAQFRNPDRRGHHPGRRSGLDVRIDARDRQPLRVVLDSRRRVRNDARVIDREPGEVLLIAGHGAGRRARRARLRSSARRASNASQPAWATWTWRVSWRVLAQLDMNEMLGGSRADARRRACSRANLVDELIAVHCSGVAWAGRAKPLLDLPPLQPWKRRCRCASRDCRSPWVMICASRPCMPA